MDALMTAYRHVGGQGEEHELPFHKDSLRLTLVHTRFGRVAYDLLISEQQLTPEFTFAA